jgi:hypothetical protein
MEKTLITGQEAEKVKREIKQAVIELMIITSHMSCTLTEAKEMKSGLDKLNDRVDCLEKIAKLQGLI